jgi:hypothetical protein
VDPELAAVVAQLPPFGPGGPTAAEVVTWVGAVTTTTVS